MYSKAITDEEVRKWAHMQGIMIQDEEDMINLRFAYRIAMGEIDGDILGKQDERVILARAGRTAKAIEALEAQFQRDIETLDLDDALPAEDADSDDSDDEETAGLLIPFDDADGEIDDYEDED